MTTEIEQAHPPLAEVFAAVEARETHDQAKARIAVQVLRAKVAEAAMLDGLMTARAEYALGRFMPADVDMLHTLQALVRDIAARGAT